jgi:hypothetical protein
MFPFIKRGKQSSIVVNFIPLSIFFNSS